MKFLRLLLLVFASSSLAFAIEITPSTLPNGTVKTAYSADIEASGGCTPYKWAFDSGNVPAGITVRPSTTTTSLILGGAPTTAGTDSFVIRVTDCRGSVSQASYKVAIQSAANHVVDLSWKPSKSPHIAGYNIYRGLNETKWEKINASLIASTLYDDSAVANGSTYYYATTAVNIEGEESAKSAAVKAIIP
jgi:hypothetical protein